MVSPELPGAKAQWMSMLQKDFGDQPTMEDLVWAYHDPDLAHLACPSGGKYSIMPLGKKVTVHGFKIARALF